MPATLEISRVDLPSCSDALPGNTVGNPSAVRILNSAELPRLMGPPVIPDPLSFAPTIHPRLKIKKAFTVHLRRYESGVAAEAPEIEEFGYGANSFEALLDLGKTIAELYLSLDADADHLSDDLKSVRAKLAEHIDGSINRK